MSATLEPGVKRLTALRNDGLGKETVLQLARHGPREIYVLARNEEKARASIEVVQKELIEKVKIKYIPLDLASLPSIRAAAAKVKDLTTRLDILILNAGVMALPPEVTEAGFEVHLGVNHVGHQLLTELLLPQLQITAAETNSDVRVVTVSSEAHHLAPSIDTIISRDRLLKHNPLTRYAASKAANVLFTAELARRVPEITCVSVHPGIVMTGLYDQGLRSSDTILTLMEAAASFISQTVADGALTQLWAAAGARKEDLTSGGYYTVETLRDWNGFANDEESAKLLWDWTEAELAKAGFE